MHSHERKNQEVDARVTFQPIDTQEPERIRHIAAIAPEGTIAATDLAKKNLSPEPEVIMPDDLEKSREKPSLIEQAVGERQDLAQYLFRYMATKRDALPAILQHVRRHADSDTLDSCYRVLLAMGANIETNPRNGDPVRVEFPTNLLEKYIRQAEIDPFPIDKLWQKARIIETDIRDQHGEPHKVAQLELSTSLENWRKIQKPQSDKRSDEAQSLSYDIETFLEKTYIAETGCKDAPMKWYTTIADNSLNQADNVASATDTIKSSLNPEIVKMLYSKKGATRGLIHALASESLLNSLFSLAPPDKNDPEQWLVIQLNHGYTGFGDLMKIPGERISLTVQQSLERTGVTASHPMDKKSIIEARVLHHIDKALGQSQTKPSERIWTVVMDGMGINGNLALDEARKLSDTVDDTYDCYANQIDFASTILHTNIEAGWSMGGYACLLALMKKLQAAEYIKGMPLTQEDVDQMDSYLPYTLPITPAMADTCWFSMVTPSQTEEMAVDKNSESITPPLETHLASMQKSRKQRLGFFVSRNMLGLGSIMHKLHAGNVEPLKSTFEFFSKLYTGQIFPHNATLTSDEQWIQTAALAHAEGFTKAGNGQALDWQRAAINNTKRPPEEGLRLLKLARGYISEFVGNQDLLVRDKDLWRELNDQAVTAPAFELPAGHALMGQDCFQEFPFGIGPLMSSKDRRQIGDIMMEAPDVHSGLSQVLRLFPDNRHKKELAKQLIKYGEKYKVRYPQKAA